MYFQYPLNLNYVFLSSQKLMQAGKIRHFWFVVVNIYNQTKCLRIIKIYEIHTKSFGIKLHVLEFITSIKIVQNIYNPAKCYNCFEILSNA